MKAISARYVNLSAPLLAERKVELGLVALVVVFLLQLLVGVSGMVLHSAPELVYPTEDSLTVSQISPAPQLAPEQREEIRERPLFWASRQPSDIEANAAALAEEEAAEAASQSGKIKNTKLAGVFGSGDSAGIIVFSKGKKKRVMTGEAVDGWTLESISPTEAVFSKKGREAKLALVRGKPAESNAEGAAKPVEKAAKPAGAAGQDQAARPKKKAAGGQKENGDDELRVGRQN